MARNTNIASSVHFFIDSSEGGLLLICQLGILCDSKSIDFTCYLNAYIHKGSIFTPEYVQKGIHKLVS